MTALPQSQTEQCQIEVCSAIVSQQPEFDHLCLHKTDTPISYRSFIKLFYNIENNTSINQYSSSFLDTYTKRHQLNHTLYQISIANKTPIAQFITDAYFQSVIKHNWTINQFMQSSHLLSAIPTQSRPWQVIRRHLSDYLKHIDHPIHAPFLMNTTSNGTNEEGMIRHHMHRILYYTKHIHHNLFALNHICQVEVVFITHKVNTINDEYFTNLGIEYQNLAHLNRNDVRATTLWSMMRQFNDSLHKKTSRCNTRCVILIMSDSRDLDVHNDTVYILEPYEHNTLPLDLIEHTELPYIITSQNDYILPGLSLQQHDALSLSIHRHKTPISERVYLRYRSYGTRVFKHNLKEVLSPFCMVKDESIAQLRWNEEIRDNEFHDPEYFTFMMTYFNDLHLIIPHISYYFDVNDASTRWSSRLYRQMVLDHTSCASPKYMYSPPAYEYYVQINALMNAYYKDMECCHKNDAFIDYIDAHEFGDCDLQDVLDVNTADECAISWFDDTFPVPSDVDIETYIFYLVSYCYMYGSLPNV
eukprot:199429_1